MYNSVAASPRPVTPGTAAAPSRDMLAKGHGEEGMQGIPERSAAKAFTSGAGPAQGSEAAETQRSGPSNVQTSMQAAAEGPPPEEPSTPSAQDEPPGQAHPAAAAAAAHAESQQAAVVEEVQTGATPAMIAAVNQQYGLETPYRVRSISISTSMLPILHAPTMKMTDRKSFGHGIPWIPCDLCFLSNLQVEPQEAAVVANRLERYRQQVRRLQSQGQVAFEPRHPFFVGDADF